MSTCYRKVILPILFLSAWSAPSVFAKPQQAPANFRVVHVIGMQGVKPNTKGKVTVSKDALEFASGTNKSEILTPSIQDALTGADSQRLIGGTLGTVAYRLLLRRREHDRRDIQRKTVAGHLDDAGRNGG